MRIARVEDVEARAGVRPGSARVHISMGYQRYSATPDEAIRFAEDLLAAAREANSRAVTGGVHDTRSGTEDPQE